MIPPEGFWLLARIGDAIPFAHIATKRTGQVPAVVVRVDSDPEALQRELDYACAKLLREIEREAA